MIPLRDSHPTGKFPFWVLAIIGLNFYVFFLELVSPNPDAFIAKYALIPSMVNPLNFHTLIPFVTSQFLHGGFIHIISNMLFLWIFGDNIEEAFGFLLFPFFYLAAGVVGAFTQYVFMPTTAVPMLGASGAIAGVLGAYFALFPHHSVKTLVPIFGFFTIMDIPASIMLFYWFATQLFSGVASVSLATSGGVAFFAHLGGFAFGWVMGSVIQSRNVD